jgi:hypothetical protein
MITPYDQWLSVAADFEGTDMAFAVLATID